MVATLPTPQAILTVDYETILSSYQTRLVGLNPALAAAVALEQSPTNIILEVEAYGKMLVQERINTVYQALRLAYATGANLEGLAADRGVLRLTYVPATATTAAVMEPDPSLQLRTWLRMQTWGSGTPLGVEYWARTLGLQNVADVHVIDYPGEGRMTCVVLPIVGLASADAETMRATIGTGLMDRSRRPGSVYIDTVLAEIVTIPYTGILSVIRGASIDVALGQALTGLQTYMSSRRRVNGLVPVSAMEASQYSISVVAVDASNPATDVAITELQAAELGQVSITPVIVDD